MEEKNYYDIFELTAEDKKLSKDKFNSKLKKAFRGLSKRYHPDIQHNKSDEEKLKAEDDFKIINEAYSVLGDDNKRQLYDRFGKDLGKSQGHGQQHGDFGHDDLQDLINQHFNGGFGGRGRQQQDPRQGASLRITVSVSLEDLHKTEGVTKKFTYNRNFICSTCDGKKFDPKNGSIQKCQHCGGQGVTTIQQGNMFFQTRCEHCGGSGQKIINGCKACNQTGVVSASETIEVNIPAGSIFNQHVIVTNKGSELLFNNQKLVGDLIVQIQPLPHKDFEIDQQGNLHTEKNVNILDCIIGETIKFKSIDGSEKQFKLKVGTKDKEQFRMNGLGIAQNNYDRTSLYVHINHVLPTELNEKEVEILENLKQSKNFKK